MSAQKLTDGDSGLVEGTPRSFDEVHKAASSSNSASATVEHQTSHREKEKKRRQIMHEWLCRLEKLLPNDVCDYPRAQLKKQSKSKVLERTVQFILLLQKTNQHQQERVKQLTIKCTALQSMNIDQIGQELQAAQDENRQLKQLLAASQKQRASASDSGNA